MPDSAEIERMREMYRAADEVLASVTREAPTRAARLLAIKVAHYRSRYGDCHWSSP